MKMLKRVSARSSRGQRKLIDNSIFDHSELSNYQKMNIGVLMKVAFQGEPGAYSEQAVFNYFGEVETLPRESFDAVFDAVNAQECDAGLIPIENSLAGSIHQ